MLETCQADLKKKKKKKKKKREEEITRFREKPQQQENR